MRNPGENRLIEPRALDRGEPVVRCSGDTAGAGLRQLERVETPDAVGAFVAEAMAPGEKQAA